MKKVLIPVCLLLSTTFAFADGLGGAIGVGGLAGGGGVNNNLPTTSSSVRVRQVIDGVTNSTVANQASVDQLALGVGNANASARTSVRQGIYNVDNSIAVNHAEVTNYAIGLNP